MTVFDDIQQYLLMFIFYNIIIEIHNRMQEYKDPKLLNRTFLRCFKTTFERRLKSGLKRF